MPGGIVPGGIVPGGIVPGGIAVTAPSDGLPVTLGAAVAGGGGELLGHVGAVYLDNATGTPAWAAVRGGDGHAAVVPLHLARFDGAVLHVPYTAAQLRAAPHHDPAALISYPEGEDLARHYGLLPTSPPPAALSAGRPSVMDGEYPGDQEVVVTRSAEQLRVGTVDVAVGRARLVTYLVTENHTFTVPVTRQEVRLVYDPIPTADQVITTRAPAEAVHEVVVHAEQVLFTKQVVPVERVRMVKRVVTAPQTVTETLRAEQVDLDLADG